MAAIDAPVTQPDVPMTVAIEISPLVQAPPPVPSVRQTVRPEHTGALPLMTSGNGFTVATVYAAQPVGSV